MDKEQLNILVKWLNKQVENSTKVIEEAHQTSNYGRETHYLGMRDAFIKMLSKLPQLKA